MARNVYSFVKIEHRHTKRGLIYTAAGIGSILCLVILMLISFVRQGALPEAAGAIAYISFAVAVLALFLAHRLRKDADAYGRMLHSAFYVDLLAVIFHGMVFVLGCMRIILA